MNILVFFMLSFFTLINSMQTDNLQQIPEKFSLKEDSLNIPKDQEMKEVISYEPKTESFDEETIAEINGEDELVTNKQIENIPKHQSRYIPQEELEELNVVEFGSQEE